MTHVWFRGICHLRFKLGNKWNYSRIRSNISEPKKKNFSLLTSLNNKEALGIDSCNRFSNSNRLVV